MKKILTGFAALVAACFVLSAVSCSFSSDSGSGGGSSSSASTSGSPSVVETTGTVSLDASVSKVTVTFKDAEYEGKNADEVFTLVNGQNSNAKIPTWTRANYDLSSWTSNVDGVTVKSALTQDVTFTAVWREYYTVTFKDSSDFSPNPHEDETVKVYVDAETKTVTAPSWTAEGYTLSWEGDVTAEITGSTTFTAVWTARTAYTVTYKDSEVTGIATNADVTESVYEGDKPKNVPSWTKTNYTLSWNTSTDVAITDNTTFTAVWTEKPHCTNCGTHYETEAEAAACAVKSGCPKFVAVTEGTYSLVKTEFEADKGITATCTLDSSGANLKKDSGYVKFAIASSMVLTFTDDNSKTVELYKVNDDGTVSSTAETNDETAPNYKYTLSAGTYMMKGTSSSSAKIKSLKFESATFTSKTENVTNNEATLGLTATNVESGAASIVTAAISGENIVLTSVAAGTATVTCKDASSNTATITVTVSGGGSISYTVTKYVSASAKVSAGSEWKATDAAIPSWLNGISEETETASGSKYVAFGLGFTKSYIIAKDSSIKLTAASACKIKVYIAGNNNTANKGTVVAKIGDTQLGESYNLPSRTDSTATPFEFTVSADQVDKEITITTTYASLLYQISVVAAE